MAIKSDTKQHGETAQLAKLKANGPTLEQFVSAGYAPEQYPPQGYAEVPSPALTKFRSTGEAPKQADEKTETHLVVRSRNERFRRAGLTFTGEYSVYSLDDLGPAIVRQVEAEPMLETRRITAYEADRFQAGKMPGDDESVTKAELRQWVAQEKQRADRAEAEVERLTRLLSGADRPPPPGKMPDGSPIV